jgi:hypothetical protein
MPDGRREDGICRCRDQGIASRIGNQQAETADAQKFGDPEGRRPRQRGFFGLLREGGGK